MLESTMMISVNKLNYERSKFMKKSIKYTKKQSSKMIGFLF